MRLRRMPTHRGDSTSGSEGAQARTRRRIALTRRTIEPSAQHRAAVRAPLRIANSARVCGNTRHTGPVSKVPDFNQPVHAGRQQQRPCKKRHYMSAWQLSFGGNRYLTATSARN